MNNLESKINWCDEDSFHTVIKCTVKNIKYETKGYMCVCVCMCVCMSMHVCVCVCVCVMLATYLSNPSDSLQRQTFNLFNLLNKTVSFPMWTMNKLPHCFPLLKKSLASDICIRFPGSFQSLLTGNYLLFA